MIAGENPHLIFVLGGARSGKSGYALRLVEQLPGPYAFLATAEAYDAEMADRIARHRAERGPQWITHDAPLDLAGVLRALPQDRPALIDCLTLWLSNHLLADADLEDQAECLSEALAQRTAPTVVVSNEVGLGIVPDNALARRFRDAAGRLNQQVARQARAVVFMVAGLPLFPKGCPDWT
ncbi:bifunctional adenosylcobinamide kinase/adenosylcobinamide-phosphate guanylyltransferase [Aquabacter sediminis]|uniref:bifunctional adenosylcobinamide kinase/adenosylcobinamide-phosphate guanylyltransferase n=1 Tax=Aquabacter sediminis TaxID=3029197 RepID=UPI00237E418B|nr:bifunctional adenosylcobinamide kinase/adenosylcobinamide-phosphate guanylyltransferase [Aquabacter sp. P-9]MDE1566683.1 bifunctional adenosylcobinamide kinase/adenosylcobinamide-phosphate guanylyltransferase [Aquabacter sp. P-9]